MPFTGFKPESKFLSGLDHYGVFIMLHTKTGRFYVGTGNSMIESLSRTRSLLRCNKHFNDEFQKAYNDSSDCQYFFNITKDKRKALEIKQRILDRFYSTGEVFNHIPKAEFNLSDIVRDREMRKKISDGMRRHHRERKKTLTVIAEKKPIVHRVTDKNIVVGDQIYRSISDAADDLGISIHQVAHRCRSSEQEYQHWQFC